jgi:hypothetical protein
MINSPVSKLDKPASLAWWNLNMNKFSILHKNLSQMIIRDIRIQIANKNLQWREIRLQTSTKEKNLYNTKKYARLYYLDRSRSVPPLEDSDMKLHFQSKVK